MRTIRFDQLQPRDWTVYGSVLEINRLNEHKVSVYFQNSGTQMRLVITDEAELVEIYDEEY